jgi:transglutaminase-like putative cysteine protease
MKSVGFKYQTELAFSSPASEHKFSLRILPRSDGRQSVKSLSWRIDPAPVEAVWRSADSFGNESLCGRIDAPHEYFRFGIEGTAEVSGEPYTSGDEPPRTLLYPTELTRPHGGLVELYNNIVQSAPADTLERIQYFSHTVHTKLRYERGATTNATTAGEAFDGGAGVCQDYAHILLAILRQDKIPCRYVAGLASDYGETHAWVEAWIRDKYCGTDPTRDKLIDENYIAISRGRDFADCTIERGLFKGACRGTQKVNLSMEVA